ncbi:hypothetical protein CEXT_220111 [Caerostris extrusa]|uniref:Uncharacterized protein n=1 Tax=Caerostris extrusa TaxID=172846 RepID=A0AAV4NHU2_CAEEX|nr:hypothetical protein CEXT_220111 [Caerostris extrusa]
MVSASGFQTKCVEFEIRQTTTILHAILKMGRTLSMGQKCPFRLSSGRNITPGTCPSEGISARRKKMPSRSIDSSSTPGAEFPESHPFGSFTPPPLIPIQINPTKVRSRKNGRLSLKKKIINKSKSDADILARRTNFKRKF